VLVHGVGAGLGRRIVGRIFTDISLSREWEESWRGILPSSSARPVDEPYRKRKKGDLERGATVS